MTRFTPPPLPLYRRPSAGSSRRSCGGADPGFHPGCHGRSLAPPDRGLSPAARHHHELN